MRATASLLLCLLLGSAAAGRAQMQDLMIASASPICSLESGTAADVCNEYCSSLACPRVDGDDAASAPAAGCAEARERFKSLTGRDVPCEEFFACPCADLSRWSDFSAVTFWQSYALGAFNRSFTTCQDDASVTEIEEWAPDLDPTRVGVDVSGPECTVFVDGITTTLRIGGKEARVCQRLLRRAGGSLCQ